MATENLIRIEDSEENVFYPHTRTSVVFDNEGKSLETRLSEMQDEIEAASGGGDGVTIGNVTGFAAKAGNARVSLSWTDPQDVELSGVVLAKWSGTRIVRKVGSYPQNQNDGVVVVNSAVRNQYAVNPFVDTTVTNGETYYYSAFPYSGNKFNAKSDAVATPMPYVIYGVKIDTANSNPSTAVTYIEESAGFTPASGNNGAFKYGSWADKFPFNAIKPCLYKNGAVVGYLNPNNYAQFVDGSAADITSGNAGDVMIEFPTVYWKFETVGTALNIRLSDAQVDASYKPLGHTRGTTVKDKVYIGAYLGFNSGGKLRSLSGKTPTATQTIGTFRTQAQANGANYEQMAYFPLLMTQVLYLVMLKSRDSQTALGRGYVDGNSAATTTGGANTKGMFYGETTGKQQLKFCGIEDWYGNLRYFIDGIFSDASRNLLMATQGFNDTGAGYANYGSSGFTADAGGYINTVQGGTETGFIVKGKDGSETTHYADYGTVDASRMASFSGFWSDASYAGAFYLDLDRSASTSNAYCGGRLLAF